MKHDEKTIFLDMVKTQNNAVKRMFESIDENDVKKFHMYYIMWHVATNKLLHNKYNECGHKLCDEIQTYARNNNITIEM